MPALIALSVALVGITLEPGFQPLFNGRDLDGWTAEGDESGWVVEEEGTLLTVGSVDGGWLSTDREYGDFVLRLEYLLSEIGNSGVIIRGFVPGSANVEVQLLAPWTPTRDDLHCTGSLYGHVPVFSRPDETTGVWHSLEVSAIGKDIAVKVDGVEVCRANTDEVESLAGSPLSGRIALQSSHSGPEEWVRFRNLRIRDLDAEPNHLAAQLRSGDAEIRAHAQECSARLGAAMLPELLRLHAEGTPQALRTAEGALALVAARGLASQGGSSALSALMARELQGQWPTRTRGLLLETLAIVGNETCIPSIVGAMGEPELAYPAALALARIGGAHATDALATAVTGPKAEAALAAASALSTMGPGSGESALIGALGSRNVALRVSAVTALGSMGTAACAPSLVTALRDPAPEVRKAARGAAIRLAVRLGGKDYALAEVLLTRVVGTADSGPARVSAVVAALRLGASESSPVIALCRSRDRGALAEAERLAAAFAQSVPN